MNYIQSHKMERDKIISGLIREAGMEKAPKGFTSGVMDRLVAQPEKKPYRPPIGKRGWWFIGLFAVFVLVLVGLAYDPGSSSVMSEWFSGTREWKLPELGVNTDFFSRIKLSGGVAAGCAALFILVFLATRSERHHLA